MSDSMPNATIQYVNYKDEVAMRMQEYFRHPDLISLFMKAREVHKASLYKVAQNFNQQEPEKLLVFDQNGTFPVLSKITLIQIENLARDIGLCGYGFLESGQDPEMQRFDQQLPLRHQPYLDELFEAALHRELKTLQHHINDFLEVAKLDLQELSELDQGAIEISVIHAEKIAQGVFRPAFEMIKHEYIQYASSKIREYNPCRIFHRLDELNEETKLSIMQYIRYMVQADLLITEGEVNFTKQLIARLQMENFDVTNYLQSLLEIIEFSELPVISQFLPEATLRQILGLVVDCAYADKILQNAEGARILEIAGLILGDYKHIK